jgi:hypothetical protein
MNTTQRIEQLERYDEWLKAFEVMDRLLAFAVHDGRCTAAEADVHRASCVRMVPLETFVKGTWMPPPSTPENTAYADELQRQAAAWEASREGSM